MKQNKIKNFLLVLLILLAAIASEKKDIKTKTARPLPVTEIEIYLPFEKKSRSDYYASVVSVFKEGDSLYYYILDRNLLPEAMTWEEYVSMPISLIDTNLIIKKIEEMYKPPNSDRWYYKISLAFN